MSNTLERAGDIEVLALDIGTNSGWMSIKGLYEVVDLYEDLFSPTINGTILIDDTQGILTTLPIIGSELLRIQFKTPTMGEKKQLENLQ